MAATMSLIAGTLACATLLGVVGAVSTAPAWVASFSTATAAKELAAIETHRDAMSTAPFDVANLHLSALPQHEETAANKRLKVGDRITIGGGEGLKHVLEILTVQHTTVALPIDVPTATGRSKTMVRASDLTIVTARNVEAPSMPPVRLIFEVGDDGRASPTEKPSDIPRTL